MSMALLRVVFQGVSVVLSAWKSFITMDQRDTHQRQVRGSLRVHVNHTGLKQAFNLLLKMSVFLRTLKTSVFHFMNTQKVC